MYIFKLFVGVCTIRIQKLKILDRSFQGQTNTGRPDTGPTVLTALQCKFSPFVTISVFLYGYYPQEGGEDVETRANALARNVGVRISKCYRFVRSTFWSAGV